jgi:ribosome recycling factor
MTEEIEFILDSTKESMMGSIVHLEKAFLNIRAGKILNKGVSEAYAGA